MNNKNLCYYGNFTSQMQIARIKNLPNLKFERVVFPGDRLLFEALPEAQLEVYINKTGSEMLLNKISCDRLRVNEGTNLLTLTSPRGSN
jgi:3-hydroxymyristoyl/3-hydroxydecanoyl-(acyl carrier protein) dehydratase